MSVIYQMHNLLFWKLFFEKLSEIESHQIKYKLLHLSSLHSVVCSLQSCSVPVQCEAWYTDSWFTGKKKLKKRKKDGRKEGCVEPCRSSITSAVVQDSSTFHLSSKRGKHFTALATWYKPNISTHTLIASGIEQMPWWSHKGACEGSLRPSAPFIAAAGEQQSARPPGRSAGREAGCDFFKHRLVKHPDEEENTTGFDLVTWWTRLCT